MKILKNKLWQADLDKAIEAVNGIDVLEGQTVMVTGPTGLICSAMIDLLIRYNETHAEPINIVAAGRNKERVQKRFGKYSRKGYFKFVNYDASEAKLKLKVEPDFIIHGASNANPSTITREPVETMLSNFNGLYNLLEYARKTDTRKVVYISSSEVYGSKDDEAAHFKEEDYGFVDLLSPRSSYPVSKRAAETLAVCYSNEYGINVNSVRPGHIYGPTANASDNRVCAEFARMAANNQELVMKSAGTQLRSYTYVLDCASAILTVLLHGENTVSYNVGNPDSIISIKEMAVCIAKAGKVGLTIDIPKDNDRSSFSAMTSAALNTEKLEALGWKGQFDAETGFGHTVEILREIGD